MNDLTRKINNKSSSIKLAVIAIHVRTNVKAGNWSCSDCAGQAMGNSLFKASCGSCYQQ